MPPAKQMTDDRTPVTPGLADFAGQWWLRRRIEDNLSGQPSRFEGTATFAPEASGLTYEELGTLTMRGSPPMQAKRRYLWSAQQGRIEVRFADGRAFHSFESGSTAQAEHLCGADLYRVRYTFYAWPNWTVKWRVTGPRKDYLMRTDFAPR